MRPADFLFPEAYASKQMRLCPFCHVAVNPGDFRDPISLREYETSGLCQKCQDEIFSNPFGN